jgi:aldehyde:ferredoxin oxidoreductase
MASRNPIEGTLLRIDLRRRTSQRESIPREYAETLLGGRALAASLLYREVPAGVDPLGPENRLIMSTGPLTGTGAFGSHHYCVTTKSPLTGLYLDTLSSGYFGRELKWTGNDVVIIEGKSEEPVYVVIAEDGVSFKDGKPVWGMSTGEAQALIRKSLPGKRIGVASIGPAGERLVPYAGVVNEERVAARGGAGAVMGSKNLKAVVVSGRKQRPELAEPAVFMEAMREAKKGIAANPMLSKRFPVYGTMGAIAQRNSAGTLVIRNFQEVSDDRFNAIDGPAMEKKGLIVKSSYCAAPCTARCAKEVALREGPYAPLHTRGPEYETLYALGTCCGISEVEAVINGEFLCNSLGLDSMSTGVSIAFAMECYERGIITRKETGGLDLRFGNAAVLDPLIKDIAYRRGFGETVALGTKKMADLFGKGSEEFAIHAKGLEIGGYDPRVAKGMALVYACGPRGGCHHAGGFTAMDPMQGQEIDAPTEAALVKASRERRVFCDSAIFCTFLAVGVKDEVIAALLRGVTGLNRGVGDLYAIGDRGSNLERSFNVREGLRRNWDTLPARLLKENLPGAQGRKGQGVRLEPLLDAFYAVCGWDKETGIPTREKLVGLGLETIASDLNL